MESNPSQSVTPKRE
jgi:SHAQKYF class myb-like DNA-binding protein